MKRREREPQWVELGAASLQASAGGQSQLVRRSGTELGLRPRSGPELLDLGAEVLVTRLFACIGVCVLIWLPLRAVTPFYVEFMKTNPLFTQGEEGTYQLLYWMLLMLPAQGLAAIISTTSVTVLVHSELVGRPTRPMKALGKAMRRLPALVTVFLIQLVVVGLSAGLMAVLGFFCPPFLLIALAIYAYFSWKFSVAPSALVLEELGVFSALRRSWNLTRGSFLRWCGLSILAGLLILGLKAGLQLGDAPNLNDQLVRKLALPKPVFDVIFVGIFSVFSGITTAVVAAAMTVYYLDTRIRREGFDLAMRLERLRVAHSGATESSP